LAIPKGDGLEPIPGLNGRTLMEFWSWAFSDVLVNTTRGVFAEFLVGEALGVTGQARVEWDAVDLRYGDLAIEVKSAAYWQSWEQSSPSTIRFDIAEKQSWHADSNINDEQANRSADCYVFCLYAEEDRACARRNVLDTTCWRFYVVPTSKLDLSFGTQKGVALSRIEEIATAVPFANLKGRVDAVLAESQGD